MARTDIKRPGAGRWATCRYCKRSEGLRWNETGTRLVEWQRFGDRWEPTNNFHSCDEYRQARAGNSSVETAENAASIMAGAIPSNGHKPSFTVHEPTSTLPPYQPPYQPPTPAIQPQPTTPVQNNSNGYSRESIERIASELDKGWVQVLVEQVKRLDTKAGRLETETAKSITAILEIVEEIRQARKNVIEVKRPDGTVKNVGRQHKAFADILFYLGLRKHVFMVGPAGSGKSTAAEKAADALGLKFYVQPMGPAMTDVRFLGYQDANGKLVRTMFREAYEHGGVFCADEMDKCHAGTLTAINGAIANGHCGFPDGMVARHKDFVMVAAANTWGHGATSKYIGATKLDGSTLNRFLKVVFDYDEEFERELVGHDPIGSSWCLFVQKVRKIVFTHKLECIVSPRQSLDGADLLRAGHPKDKVESVTLWNDMSEDTANLIRRNLGR